MIAAAVLAGMCSWNFPGADPTTSPPSVTLRKMGIVSPTLAKRIERGDYDELVPVRRNDRRLYGMSSGNARWCAGEVDTSLWAPDHVEWVRVFREAGVAVAKADACSNLGFWRAPADLAPLAPFLAPSAGSPDEPLPAGPLGVGPHLIPAELPVGSPAPDAGPWSSAWLPGGFGGYGSIVVTTCECCVPINVPAVIEPREFATLAMGLAALWWMRRKA